MASYFSIHLPVHTTLGGFSSPAKGGNFKSALTDDSIQHIIFDLYRKNEG
jgi:hypothetical protein